MKIAVFGKNFEKVFNEYIERFFNYLFVNKAQLIIYQPFYQFIKDNTSFRGNNVQLFNKRVEIPADIDFLISIGGDGTFLESLMYLNNFDTPVIGLNSGRLGYLANISKDEIEEALDSIFSGNYELEKRSLLTVDSKINPFGEYNFALNDATIQKKDTTLITIDAYLNNEYLNTYWTDGLIISTPTGSTAYSLSVGGPIILPGSNNLVLAPIASHNLTVRPVVIPDELEIRLEVKSRGGKFLVSVDNRTEQMDISNNVFTIKKAKRRLCMVRLPFNNYYSTLRSKLMWGADKRN